MRPLLTHGFYVSFIAIAMSTGCTSVSPSKNGRAPVDLQHQHAVALSVGRYVAILQAIDEGNLDEVKSDIDWWIDLSIIELQWIEELQPDGDWGSVQLPYSSLTMRGFYRSIAHFRRDHPRRHAIPLDAETLKLIEKFVQKYQ